MEDQRNTGKVAVDFIRQFWRTYDRKTTQAQLADRMNISALMVNVLLTRKKYDDPHFWHIIDFLLVLDEEHFIENMNLLLNDVLQEYHKSGKILQVQRSRKITERHLEKTKNK